MNNRRVKIACRRIKKAYQEYREDLLRPTPTKVKQKDHGLI